MSLEDDHRGGLAALPEQLGLLQQLRDAHILFALVLVGELLAVVLVIARYGVANFDMVYFGLVSFQVLWVILGSIAVMVVLTRYLARYSMAIHLLVSYVLVLLVTLLTSVVGQVFIRSEASFDYVTVLNSIAISAIFAGVFLRYMYLQAQLQQQRQSEATARLSALQARIRPHFLFNSLNSIASLIPVDAPAAEKMVVDLAHLFRANIQHRGLIPLEDELTLCRRYVGIESLRFGNRLQVDWRVDIKDQHAQVPALLLQPLVENAIVHGIQGLTEGGSICVKVTAEHGNVVLSVSNPVPDIDRGEHDLPDGKQRGQTALGREQEESAHNGMALDNIRHRLVAHFGASAELTDVLDREHQRFTVTARYKSGATQ